MHFIEGRICNNPLLGGRSSITTEADTVHSNATETETNVDVEEYFIPDVESLAKQREKYCIQCLEKLGEYVEVLGPVLHEKGVDVCIALLQQNSKHTEPSEVARLLPDIMKLICALAAHRKFAALFVDRGGMQKLLSVPRVAQTFFGLSSCLFTIGSLQVMAFLYIHVFVCVHTLFKEYICIVFTIILAFMCFVDSYCHHMSYSGYYGACLCTSLRRYTPVG